MKFKEYLILRLNQVQVRTYGVTQEEVYELICVVAIIFRFRSGGFFLYHSVVRISEIQKKAWKDLRGWLEGRTFVSPRRISESIGRLSNLHINQYGIINQVGFDRYQIKDLTYSLTKASAVGPVKSNPILWLFLTIGLCISGP
ncbi:MAG: hypothetical protein U5K54_21120 [Cytophagales bacterium]|nr:hypothetical protein [Cytophagales bacterium]